jgi:chromosome segregation ATPase
MEEEVAEAGSLIRFMSRCCLFQVLCCCCADSKEDIRRDRTRKSRLKQRRGEDEVVRRAISMATQDKKMAFDSQFTSAAVDDEELERVASKYRPKNQPYGAKYASSDGVPRNAQRSIITEEQMEDIAAETKKQDQLLDSIGSAVDKLKMVGEAMQSEFNEQDPQVDRLQGRVVETKYSLNTLTSKARRI